MNAICDIEGSQYLVPLPDSIGGKHRKDEIAVDSRLKCTCNTKDLMDKLGRQTAKGWKLCFEWKDGSTLWKCLADLWSQIPWDCWLCGWSQKLEKTMGTYTTMCSIGYFMSMKLTTLGSHQHGFCLFNLKDHFFKTKPGSIRRDHQFYSLGAKLWRLTFFKQSACFFGQRAQVSTFRLQWTTWKRSTASILQLINGPKGWVAPSIWIIIQKLTQPRS